MTDTRKSAIAAAFGAAAHGYDTHAAVQRMVANRLADRVAALPLPAVPRVLEIGCGTGFLTRALRERLGVAEWFVTDLSPDMVARCRAGFEGAEDIHFAVMDGERVGLGDLVADGRGFDLICSSLAAQWFADLPAALAAWARALAPGGYIAYATVAAGTLAEWCEAHEALGFEPGVPPFATPESLVAAWPPGGDGRVEVETIPRRHPDAHAFLTELRGIGAHLPAEGRAPLPAGVLRRLMRRFAAPAGIEVSWRIAYGIHRRFPDGGAARSGRTVFVTGTDTDVGKTLASACLVKAWSADYWKPVQTGVAVDRGDGPTVTDLAGLTPDRLLPPAAVFQEPLSPHAAAASEGRSLTLAGIERPARADQSRPLVVEGAGGLLVPLGDGTFMVDLIEKLAAPVVLVARSGLGTINHTLLSIEALRARGLPLAGVIMSGPPNPSNRHAIETYGQTRVLAEIPRLDRVDAETVAKVAAELIPPLDTVAP